MLLHDAVGARETEAAATLRIFRAEEWLEHVVEDVLGHPLAGVRHAEQHVATDLRPRVGLSVGAVDEHHLGLDPQSSAHDHCVASVDDEVHQHLLELARIGIYGAQAVSRHDLELDGLAHHGADERQHPIDELVQIQSPRLKGLTPAESQKPSSQIGGALPGVEHFGHHLPGTACGQLPLEELRVVEDDREQIVEVVGDTSSEAPHRFQSLPAQQLVLQPTLGSSIGYVASDPHGRSVPVAIENHVLYRVDHAPRSRAELDCVVGETPGFGQRCQKQPRRFGRWEELEEAGADDLGGRLEPECADECRIRLHEATIWIGDEVRGDVVVEVELHELTRLVSLTGQGLLVQNRDAIGRFGVPRKDPLDELCVAAVE